MLAVEDIRFAESVGCCEHAGFLEKASGSFAFLNPGMRTSLEPGNAPRYVSPQSLCFRLRPDERVCSCSLALYSFLALGTRYGIEFVAVSLTDTDVAVLRRSRIGFINCTSCACYCRHLLTEGVSAFSDPPARSTTQDPVFFVMSRRALPPAWDSSAKLPLLRVGEEGIVPSLDDLTGEPLSVPWNPSRGALNLRRVTRRLAEDDESSEDDEEEGEGDSEGPGGGADESTSSSPSVVQHGGSTCAVCNRPWSDSVALERLSTIDVVDLGAIHRGVQVYGRRCVCGCVAAPSGYAEGVLICSDRHGVSLSTLAQLDKMLVLMGASFYAVAEMIRRAASERGTCGWEVHSPLLAGLRLVPFLEATRLTLSFAQETRQYRPLGGGSSGAHGHSTSV